MPLPDQNTPVVIYALADPRNVKVIRYIGQTANTLKVRLEKHVTASKIRTTKPLSIWFLELAKDGVTPKIYPIELCDGKIALSREFYWINFFWPLGTLLNVDRFQGQSGVTAASAPESIAKMSASKTGKKMSDFQRQRWIESGGKKKFMESRLSPVRSSCGRFWFKSHTEAAKWIGVDGASIHSAISNSGLCMGLFWNNAETPPPTEWINPSADGLKRIFRRHLGCETIVKIKELFLSGVSQPQIASQLNINQSTVSRVLHGRKRNQNASYVSM